MTGGAPHRRWRALLGGPALACASVLFTLTAIELTLWVVDYRYSPLAFLPPATRADARPLHMGLQSGLAGNDVTMFDPELLWAPRPGWRLSPGGPVEINAQRLRGAEAPWPKRPADFVILALGDSNTAGPLDRPDHWPADLQHLLDLNRSDRSIRVLNAGVYGYTSFQGLRRLRQLLQYEPDLVFVSFGANDGHTVRVADDEYASRTRWLQRLAWFRFAPPLAQRLWDLKDGLDDRTGTTLRVDPLGYRRNLVEIVNLARTHRAAVVLLTRPYLTRRASPTDWMFYAPRYRALTCEVAREKGVPCLDVYAAFDGRAELFADSSHFNRAGFQEMAEYLLAHLARTGVVTPEHLRAPSVDLGAAPDNRPEIRAGWWPAEPWGGEGLRGRWTSGTACVQLERSGAERDLQVDLTLHNPSNETLLRVETNGIPVASLRGGNGRHLLRADLSAISGRSLSVCLVTERTFVPKEQEPPSQDARSLGVFVHKIAIEP